MFKVGDEVYVKAQVVDTDAQTFECYNHKVQFLDSINNEWDWVSESAISDKTYEKGLEDAWELAKKIRVQPKDGGIPLNEIENIFGTTYIDTIFKNNTYEEAFAKIEAYEREKEIKVGDVVKGDIAEGIVTRIKDNVAHILWSDGSCGKYEKGSMKKTGKHIDIESLLKQIGE